MSLCSLFCPPSTSYTIYNLPSCHILSPLSLPLSHPSPLSLVSTLEILHGTLGVEPLVGSILHYAELLALLSLHDPSSITFSLRVFPSHVLPHPLIVLFTISALTSSPYDQNNHSVYVILSAPQPARSSPPHGLPRRHNVPRNHILCHYC